MTEEEKQKLKKIIDLAAKLRMPLFKVGRRYGAYGIFVSPEIFEDPTFRGLLKDSTYPLDILNRKEKSSPQRRLSAATYSIISNIVNTNKSLVSIESLANSDWEDIKHDNDSIATLVGDVFFTWNDQDAGYRKPRKVNNEMVRGYMKMMNLSDWNHGQLIQAIKNYALWERCAREDERVWFHRWDLDEFMISQKAIRHCWDRSEMIKEKKLNVGRADSKQIKYYTREELFAEDAK